MKSTINTYLLMVCAVGREIPRTLQRLLSLLVISAQLWVIPALAQLASPARSVGQVTSAIIMKFLLEAAVQIKVCLHTVLQIRVGIIRKWVCCNTAAPDINELLLIALNTQAGPQQVAKTVDILLSHPAAPGSIRSCVLQEAFLLAVQQLNFTTVRYLAQLPAARAAVGKTSSDGQGLLSHAFTTQAALSPQDWSALLEDVYDLRPRLRKRVQLSAADKVLLIRMEVALALLDSPAANGLCYNDLLAAGQHVIPLLALPLGVEANVGKYTAAFQIAARVIPLIAQQGHKLSVRPASAQFGTSSWRPTSPMAAIATDCR